MLPENFKISMPILGEEGLGHPRLDGPISIFPKKTNVQMCEV